MKKRLLFGIILFILFVPVLVLADTIYNIDMHVSIDKYGVATFDERWDVRASGGSQWYKTYNNLGNMNLYDFKVTMDGNYMQEKNYWDINGSMAEKAGYYGINRTESGIELCFGKSDYNRHTFNLSYKLNNMIFNTSDSQVLYFTFLPKITVDNYNIVIDSYYSFPNTLDVWGYGAKGYAYVEDGKIMMSNEGSVNGNYVTLLAKFPTNTFITDNMNSEFDTFDSVHDRAEEGTYDYDYGNKPNFLVSIIEYIVRIAFNLFIPFMVIITVIKNIKKNKYGYMNNKKINKENTPFYRDIPCNRDIYYANTLIKLNEFNYKESSILGAIILKWVKENRITFINTTEGIFNKKTSKIDMRKPFNPDINTSSNEVKLFEIMYNASKDGILETRELEKWARNNYSKFLSCLKSFADDNIDKLKAEGHITKRINKKDCKYLNVMDDKIYQDSKELYGLKLFLEEFSVIKEREAIEVKVWDEYLMFAFLFGIADKVANQFKNLYPEIIEEMGNTYSNMDFDTLIFINNISTDSVYAANSARASAESYSSGGGGFSSGGGGGGSFGGGGSMGGR